MLSIYTYRCPLLAYIILETQQLNHTQNNQNDYFDKNVMDLLIFAQSLRLENDCKCHQSIATCIGKCPLLAYILHN